MRLVTPDPAAARVVAGSGAARCEAGEAAELINDRPVIQLNTVASYPFYDRQCESHNMTYITAIIAASLFQSHCDPRAQRLLADKPA
jgi:hypothetical protein